MTLNRKKTALLSLIAVFFVALDRFLKLVAVRTSFNIDIIGDIFRFNFAANPNVAFSLPLGGIFLNILIPVILVAIIFFTRKMIAEKEFIDVTAMAYIFLGAVSNYADRLIHGYVVDYFDLQYFTVFNIADSMIVLGVAVVIVNSFRKENK